MIRGGDARGRMQGKTSSRKTPWSAAQPFAGVGQQTPHPVSGARIATEDSATERGSVSFNPLLGRILRNRGVVSSIDFYRQTDVRMKASRSQVFRAVQRIPRGTASGLKQRF